MLLKKGLVGSIVWLVVALKTKDWSYLFGEKCYKTPSMVNDVYQKNDLEMISNEPPPALNIEFNYASN